MTTVSTSVRIVDAVDRAMSAWWPRVDRAPVSPLPECAVCGATSATEMLIVTDEGLWCPQHKKGSFT